MTDTQMFDPSKIILNKTKRKKRFLQNIIQQQKVILS